MPDSGRTAPCWSSISGTYEPGSIFKMITAIAGLEEGVVTTTERITDTGIYRKYNKEWKCWYFTDYRKGHGSVDISGADKSFSHLLTA